MTDATALEINGEAVCLRDVLVLARWRGQAGFVQDAADAALIRQAAAQRHIEVCGDELQQAANDFRQKHGLQESKATLAWLAANHLTPDDWQACLETDLLTGKLRDAVTNGRVEPHFAQNRLAFDRAVISRLIVAEEEAAKELYLQIAEEGADFHALARRYSCDLATRPSGGYVGVVGRGDLEPALESAVWGAHPGSVVGPVNVDRRWQLVRVEALCPAVLDDTVRASIKTSLWDEWLRDQRARAKIVMPLWEPPHQVPS